MSSKQKTNYFAIIEMVGSLMSMVTLVDRPDYMDGVWIVDHTGEDVLYILAEEAAMDALDVWQIVQSCQAVLAEFKTSRN